MTKQTHQTVSRWLASLTTLLLCLKSSTARLGASKPFSRSLTSCIPDARKVRLESTTGEQIQMFELQALSSGVNVALNKTATQSSTFGTKSASFAVDDNVTTFSHTDDINAVWEVDLADTFTLESVLIKNRWCGNPSDANGCLCRLSDATLSLLNEQGEVVVVQSIGNTCGQHDLSFNVSSCTPTTTTTSSSTSAPSTTVYDATTISPNSCYPNASKLKIESTTGEKIEMFELQVLSSGANIALDRNAFQSSTFSNKTASLAVDGDITTFSQTGSNDTSAFWEIDFGRTYLTEFVEIKNHWCVDASDPSRCLCRLTGATLTLMSEQGAVVSTKTFGDTCGVYDLSFDMSFCTPPNTELTPSITISDTFIAEDDSFGITFNNPFDKTEIYAAVVSNSACTSDNSSFMVDDKTENVSSGLSSVTVWKNISELITPDDRNSGSVKLTFCVRADVLSSSFPLSLLASKVTAEITVKFLDSSSDFRIELQTTDFSDTAVDYTSQRNPDVAVVLGRCLSPRNDGPYRIGSTLKFCVKSTDSDVVISGLNNVSFTDLNGNAILDIVDSNGDPSFVTSIAGLDSKAVDVATLMATTIYDQGYGGTTINVQGTVSVTYVNAALPSNRRQLKRTEESPFAVQIVVGENADEQTSSRDPSSATNLHHALFRIAPAFVVGLVFSLC